MNDSTAIALWERGSCQQSEAPVGSYLGSLGLCLAGSPPKRVLQVQPAQALQMLPSPSPGWQILALSPVLQSFIPSSLDTYQLVPPQPPVVQWILHGFPVLTDPSQPWGATKSHCAHSKPFLAQPHHGCTQPTCQLCSSIRPTSLCPCPWANLSLPKSDKGPDQMPLPPESPS